MILLNWTVIHLVGVVGMNLPQTKEGFEALSAINLLLSAVLILSSLSQWNIKIVGAWSAIFTIGMVVEIIGVHTGKIFGDYHYTSRLGVSLLGVPLIIGVNWVVLTLCTATWLNSSKMKAVPRIVIGAGIMVLLDMLLEYFAVKHRLWVWHDTQYPDIQNFWGWFVTGIFTHTILLWSGYREDNSYAKTYLWLLSFFLLIDYMLT